MTRRGRLVVLVLLLGLVGSVGVLIAPASDAADPRGRSPSVVVRSGDTLWSIVASYAPGDDPFDAIDGIRRLNNIDGYTIRVGERLILPAHR